MDQLFIPILLGSDREGRHSEKAARFVLEEAKTFGKFETELLDVKDFVGSAKTGAMPEEKSKLWQSTMKRADGLVIVSPEYNHGYPGELKLMLDQLYQEYNRKPAGICGVSAGDLGGARMAEVLRICLIELQMVPIREAVYFAKAHDLFNEKGEIRNPSYAERLQKFFAELVWYAHALAKARKA
jgi:NAD(P)H-dependent FMN reductase